MEIEIRKVKNPRTAGQGGYGGIRTLCTTSESEVTEARPVSQPSSIHSLNEKLCGDCFTHGVDPPRNPAFKPVLRENGDVSWFCLEHLEIFLSDPFSADILVEED